MSRIVLDANIVGRGRFNRRQLETLAKTVDGTLTYLILPELVLWEWTEHAYRAIEGHSQQTNALGVDEAIFPAPTPITVPTKDNLFTSIRKAIPPGYEVWRPSQDDLDAAVRAQVLQTGAGERKEGIKTGAADQLVLRAVRAQHSDAGGTEVVILGTRDGHLIKACGAEFGDEVVIAKDINMILRRLVEFVPAEENLIEPAERDLRDLLFESSEAAYSVVHFSAGFDIKNNEEPRAPGESERATLVRAEIVEIHDLEIGDLRGDGTHLGTALIRIFGSVRMIVRGLEQIAENDFEPIVVWEGELPGMVDVEVTLTFDQDWSVTAADASDVAIIDFDQRDD